MRRHVLGMRSEKTLRCRGDVRPGAKRPSACEALQTRCENEKKRQLSTRRIEHKVPDEQKVCPRCGGHDFTKLGDGSLSRPWSSGGFTLRVPRRASASVRHRKRERPGERRQRALLVGRPREDCALRQNYNSGD
jgi:hypothetical protein